MASSAPPPLSQEEWDNLLAYVRGLTSEDAALDIVHDAYLVAFEKNQVRIDYIWGVARNKIKEHYRHHNRLCPLLEERPPLYTIADTLESAQKEFLGDALRAAVGKLSQETQDLINGHYTGRSSQKAIAERQARSHAAARQSLARAKKTLREALLPVLMLVGLSVSLYVVSTLGLAALESQPRNLPEAYPLEDLPAIALKDGAHEARYRAWLGNQLSAEYAPRQHQAEPSERDGTHKAWLSEDVEPRAGDPNWQAWLGSSEEYESSVPEQERDDWSVSALKREVVDCREPRVAYATKQLARKYDPRHAWESMSIDEAAIGRLLGVFTDSFSVRFAVNRPAAKNTSDEKEIAYYSEQIQRLGASIAGSKQILVMARMSGAGAAQYKLALRRTQMVVDIIERVFHTGNLKGYKLPVVNTLVLNGDIRAERFQGEYVAPPVSNHIWGSAVNAENEGMKPNRADRSLRGAEAYWLQNALNGVIVVLIPCDGTE